MKYSPSTGGFYLSEVHGSSIPPDAITVSTEDYVRLLNSGKQIVAGEGGYPVNIDPPAPAPQVPSSVSPAQARLALLAAGLLDDVEAAVAAGPRAMQIAWQNASVIERDSPTVAALAGALGLTDAQLDELFTTAAGIFV